MSETLGLSMEQWNFLIAEAARVNAPPVKPKPDWDRLLGRFREAIEAGTRWQEIAAENDIRSALGIPLIRHP